MQYYWKHVKIILLSNKTVGYIINMIPTEYTNNRYYYKNNIIIFNVYSKKIYNIYYYNTRFNNLYIYIYIYNYYYYYYIYLINI